jgi:DNA-binding NarL/FixJ family response regulator
MENPSLSILIVEDEYIIAEALSEMLKNIGHQCSAIANNFEEGMNQILNCQFDLVILDINLLGRHRGTVLGQQCNLMGKPFFLLTSYSDYATINLAKAAKPGAYLVKPFYHQDILVTIEMTMMHSNSIGEGQFELFIKSLDLSERETEVLHCLKDQMTDVEIAQCLFVSKDTVKFYIKNLYLKIGVSSRSGLLSKMQTLSGTIRV